MTIAIGWARVAATFLVELAKATRDTIRAVLGPPGRLRPAILAVPLDLRSPGGITLFANAVTLTPGTTSLDVSDDRRTLYVHCLDAADPEAAILSMKSTLERRALEVLP
jgi:multicomponent Na+:H+ antiporter subunit E